MKTSIKEITPNWAAHILETRNVRNRRMSEMVVAKYANDMAIGNWCLTHQGIAFDHNGDLIDGQHRLAAVVKCKKPVMMMVTTGIPDSFKSNGHNVSVFTAIDGLKPRTAATGLELLAYKNSKALAAMARAAASVVLPNKANVMLSSANVVEIVKLFSGSFEKIASIGNGSRIIKVRAGVLGAIAYYHTTNPSEAEQFLIETQTVTGPKKSPSRALASWLSNHTNGGASQQVGSLYVAASALWHNAKGGTVEKLYGSEESLNWLVSTNRPLASKILSLFKL